MLTVDEPPFDALAPIHILPNLLTYNIATRIGKAGGVSSALAPIDIGETSLLNRWKQNSSNSVSLMANPIGACFHLSQLGRTLNPEYSTCQRRRGATTVEMYMNVRMRPSMLVLLTILMPAGAARADYDLPAYNLVGISKFHEKVIVSLNLHGAEEFRVDAEKVKKIVLESLTTASVAADGSGVGMPMLNVAIAGESTGGGGARYTVELIVRATIPSPFTENRSVEAIIWRRTAGDDQSMRYDIASKDFIKPAGLIAERVYGSVQQAASHLIRDLSEANSSK